MKPGPKLAVFDCDGTLIDSQINIIRAMASSFARHDLAAPDDHATRRIVGLSLLEAMQALLPDADLELQQSLADDYKAAFQRLRADSALDPEPLYPGIRRLLDALHGDGWQLAVATGKSDRGLRLALEHHGIHHLFVSLQTADRHPSKPHPSMLRAALAEAGAQAGQAVMIGDTIFDIAMGQAAGVRSIGVDWGYHEADELIEAGAVAVARDAGHLQELLHG
jgi:phosphoglycolate phosphatase